MESKFLYVVEENFVIEKKSILRIGSSAILEKSLLPISGPHLSICIIIFWQ